MQKQITEPRVIRGTDVPASREVASVVAVDPDGQGALIRLHIGEDLTVDAARALLTALTETLAEAGPAGWDGDPKPTTIHPALLTAAHIGALVRWEKGDTIRQGRLASVRHAAETDWLDELAVDGPSCRIETQLEIEGCDLITVRVDDDRATLSIVKEVVA